MLFMNGGDGTFTNRQLAPITSDVGKDRSGTWGDYNNDGWIDLVIPNDKQQNFLYRNDGVGGFVRVTSGPVPNTTGEGNGGAWGDYKNDGIPDLFLANPNRLFRGEGNGVFTHVTLNAGLGTGPKFGDGVGWADYNNDGLLDLVVSDADEGGPCHLYRNKGDGTFEHVTNTAISREGVGATACAWADFDNDGYIDLFASSRSDRNRLFRNNGDGTFTRVTRGSIANDPGNGGGASAWADVDNNGFPDLFVGKASFSAYAGTGRNSLFYGNDNGNRWLKFKLVGAQSNRSAFGAKVRVRATIHGQNVWQLREISAGDGFDGNSQVAMFGLAEADIADEVRIEWPSGIVQTFRDVAAKQFLTVTEPTRLEPRVTQANGLVELKVKSWKGFVYDIEASNDLKAWTRLTTLTNETGTLSFADPLAVGEPRRFYRAVGQ